MGGGNRRSKLEQALPLSKPEKIQELKRDIEEVGWLKTL